MKVWVECPNGNALLWTNLESPPPCFPIKIIVESDKEGERLTACDGGTLTIEGSYAILKRCEPIGKIFDNLAGEKAGKYVRAIPREVKIIVKPCKMPQGRDVIVGGCIIDPIAGTKVIVTKADVNVRKGKTSLVILPKTHPPYPYVLVTIDCFVERKYETRQVKDDEVATFDVSRCGKVRWQVRTPNGWTIAKGEEVLPVAFDVKEAGSMRIVRWAGVSDKDVEVMCGFSVSRATAIAKIEKGQATEGWAPCPGPYVFLRYEDGTMEWLYYPM